MLYSELKEDLKIEELERPDLQKMDHNTFVRYVIEVRDELLKMGNECLAEDMHEIANRLAARELIEQEAYSLGQLDLVNSGEYRRITS